MRSPRPGDFNADPATSIRHREVGLCAYGIADAKFTYIENAVHASKEEFEALEAVLLGNPKRRVKVFGHTHHPKTGRPYTRPRHEAVYGKDYTYSGVTLEQQRETNGLVDRVMRHANGGDGGGPFTWALVNLYRDGEDNVAMHQDNEREVGGGEVRTYSFGATRRFVFREKRAANKRKLDAGGPVREVFELAHGSCGIMSGSAAQNKWEHGVPVQKSVKRPRISITPRR